MVYDIDLVRAECLYVTVLVGIRLGARKVISGSSDRRHKGVYGYPEMLRRRVKKNICLVGHSWLFIKLFSSIRFSGLLFNCRVALMTCYRELNFVSAWLLTVRTCCCLKVQLLLPTAYIYSIIS